MKRRARVAAGTLALVAGGAVAWSNHENDHDETCFEQQAITYAGAETEGTQPERREYDC